VQLRKIPAINVVYLDWTGGFDRTDATTFREKILGPSLDMIERRGLRGQIDYIVYSADFPFSIDMSGDFPGAKFPPQASPIVSINSATYLWNLIFARLPAVVTDFQLNRYMRGNPERQPLEPVHGFRSWYGWGRQGELMDAGGQPYMLSTMLAMTSGRGNSVREALVCLQRSAAADGTKPNGVIYFSQTDDVRSKTRTPLFGETIEALKALGVQAQVINTPLPQQRPNVAGAMIGAADYNWAKSRSKILPGAICESLTSFGGILTEGAGQTPLTDNLRFGAAGSSGAVVEPFAQPEKFPSPRMHVYYAQGCTLAESFYQAMFAPAQILIVGDPLCRPWATIPRVQLEGVKPGATVSGMIHLTPRISNIAPGAEVKQIQILVDGRRAGAGDANETIDWDLQSAGSGYHEVRVTAQDNSPIESEGCGILPLMVAGDLTAELSVDPPKTVRWDQTLKIRMRSPGAQQMVLSHNRRSLGQVRGAEGEIELDPKRLGLGPVELQAVASHDGGKLAVQSLPVLLTIEPPVPLPAIAAPGKLANGLALQLASKKAVVVQETREPNWLSTAGVAANETFVLQGFFEVDSDDVYQFQVWHYGDLKLSVDGKSQYLGQKGSYEQRFIPVSLAKGMHRLTVSGRASSDPRMRILFGGPGTLSLDGKKFRHQSGR